MTKIISIHPDNPQEKGLKEIVNCLSKGGVIIYPTDTVYGLGCDIFQSSALERICKIKGIKPEKAQFSIICSDLSHLSDYAKPLSNPVFRLMKKCLPGPFTFILEANTRVPGALTKKKKTIGIRVPDHLVIRSIIEQSGHPVLSTSVHDPDHPDEYSTDPGLIAERFDGLVDLVIDAGICGTTPSTIIDCTGDEPEVTRKGLGDIEI
jgi:tRNA threonylcarbamoyl adenosine modification protein (Sua5/YciO/YrdC/YwlC family)